MKTTAPGFTTHQSKTPVHGFTLIELLVVISIIGILSVIGFAGYQNAINKAKDAKVRADIDAIRKAYETNYIPEGQGRYQSLSPTQFASGKIPTPDGTTTTSYIVAGPDGTGLNNNPSGFLACAPLNGATDTCTAASSTCACVTSTGGSGAVAYTAPPPPSFISSISSVTPAANPSFLFSVPSGNNRMLVLITSTAQDNGVCPVNKVTLWIDGSLQDFTKAGCQGFARGNYSGSVAIWYLPNPNTGNGRVIVFRTSSVSVTNIMSNWTGVDQITPLEKQNSGNAMEASGYNTAPVRVSNIFTKKNDVIVDGVFGPGGLVSPNAGQTLIKSYNNTGSSYVTNNSSSLVTSMGWSQRNNYLPWAIVAISLRNASN